MRKLIVILSFATLLTGCETMPQSQSQSLAVPYDAEVTNLKHGFGSLDEAADCRT